MLGAARPKNALIKDDFANDHVSEQSASVLREAVENGARNARPT